MYHFFQYNEKTRFLYNIIISFFFKFFLFLLEQKIKFNNTIHGNLYIYILLNSVFIIYYT